MAGRIRSIKPEILDDEEVCSLSDTAWRLWVSMWALADDHGNCRAGEKYLAAQVWQDTSRRTGEALEELQRKNRIVPYMNGGQPYANIRNWAKHQRVDNAGSPKVPGPADPGSTKVRIVDGRFAASLGEPPLVAASLGEPPRFAASRDPAAGRDGIGRDGKGAEGIRGEPRRNPPTAPMSDIPRELVAIRTALRHPAFADIPDLAAVAADRLERFRTLEIQQPGFPIGWFLVAIADAASDCTGVGLLPEAKVKTLRRYTYAPKRPLDSASGVFETEPVVDYEAEAKRLAKAPVKPSTPEGRAAGLAIMNRRGAAT